MMDDSLKWSGKLILMMKGNILQQKINILNKEEEEIHKCVSTLKLSPENKKFIIRTIGSSIDKFDKFDITKQETEQELFYKIMMMQKLLQQRMDLHKEYRRQRQMCIRDRTCGIGKGVGLVFKSLCHGRSFQ